MTASSWLLLALAGVLAALDWAAVARRHVLERWAKPLPMLALIAVVWASTPDHAGVRSLVVVALVLGLAGDVALAFEAPVFRSEVASLGSITSASGVPDGQLPRLPRVLLGEPLSARAAHLFEAGLGSFLLAHVCYAVAMLRYGTDQLSLLFGLALVLLGLCAFGYRIILGSQRAGGVRLTIAVTVYAIALGTAVVLGVGTTNLLIAYGIVVFAVSDLVLATDRFVLARSWSQLLVMVTYHVAQGLLVVGLLH